ncbi:MAG: hypothetical protein MRZ75_07460 [Roseburia sp.]|nr:hypothetical protein [Roseburia sp.]
MRKRNRMRKAITALLSGILTFGMAIGGVPWLPGNAISVKAADTQSTQNTEHVHCVCGTGDLTAGNHTCDKSQVWTPVDSLDAIASDGFYYLTQSVTLTGTWECNYDVTLCLNGNDIVGKMNDRDITVNRDKPFTLTDCHTDAGKITHEVNYSKNGVSNYGTFYMYNGNISGNTSGVDGGGVYNGSIFNLYGGSISGNKTDTCGGGVANYKTFHMYGGTISGNNASVDGGGIYNNSYATFEMKGSAVISGNTANDGGGVFNYYHVDMYDISSIRDNTAVTGGGVCNTGSSNTADFCMHDNSSITGNTATTHYGGGVYTCAGSFSMENNASITGNSAPDGSGGGVYHSGTYFEMNGGSITGNTAGLACGGGISVNSANSVELKGKVTITGNTAENGKCSNYYQDSDHVIKAANLTEGSLIGIELNYSRLPSEGNPTVFTNEGCNAAYFSSDEPSYTITASGNALALAIAPPQITAQPQDISVEPGSAATFKVSATGIGLTYQWQINQNDGKGFVDIAETNTTIYTTYATGKDCNGHKYQCVISNSAGTVTTKAATLTVAENVTPSPVTKHVITATAGANGSISPSGDVEVAEGESQTFTITPDKGYKIKSLTVDGTAVSAASTYTFENVTAAHTIDVKFQQKEATTPVESPAITTQPQNVSVKAGEQATFKVTAIGTDLTYQWQINRNDGKGFVNITGANQASYTTGVTAKDCNGFKYQCVIRNSAGTVTTKAVTLTVTEKEAATSSSYTILDGANSSWTQNTDGSLVIRGSGEISKFQSVKVDGVIIDAKNYTVTEGSTIITLSADYLKTLSVGSHTIELVWTDGSTSTNFNIVKNTADTGSNNTDENTQSVTSPQTGDNSNPALWTTLLLASFAGLAGMFAKRKKNDCK